MPDRTVAPEASFEFLRSSSESEPCTNAEVLQLRRSLRNALAERDAYAQDLFEANRAAAELSGQRQALIDREKAAVDREKAAVDREKAAVDREKAARDQVAAIHASSSWMMTKPIRFAKRLLIRILGGGRLGVDS